MEATCCSENRRALLEARLTCPIDLIRAQRRIALKPIPDPDPKCPEAEDALLEARLTSWVPARLTWIGPLRRIILLIMLIAKDYNQSFLG